MKSIFLTLTTFILFNIGFSQVKVQGKIQTTSGLLFQKYKIVVEKDKELIDSFYSNDLGYYNILLKSGQYVFHVSKDQLNRSFPIEVGEKSSTINLYIDSKNESLFKIPHTRDIESLADKIYGVGSTKSAKSVSPPTMHKKSGAETSRYFGMDYDGMSESPEPSETTYRAGQLTAGHWRDLDNWSDWLNTISDHKISLYASDWGFYLNSNLITVNVKDLNNDALPFAKIICMGQKNDTLWISRSDINGQAYVWPGAFQNQNYEQLKLIISHNQTTKTIFINPQKKNHLVNLDVKKPKITQIELGFVMDATGSMGDEINYLKNELTDVISRIQKPMPCLIIKTGAVFYKDHSDEYVSRCIPLSENTASTITFISEHFGGGGGDYPEAVDVAMEKSINELNWSENNSTKLMFLLLDAPPHEDSISLMKMRKYSKLASEKGIQIIPIAASGINQKTEFLMKSMAIVTNGEYIYITDDSKIGNSHIKPSGGESKVTFLNDLLVNTILKYCGDPCKNYQYNDPTVQDDSNFQNENRNIIVSDSINVTVYPNPCVDYIIVKCNKKANRVLIYDLAGKLISTTISEDELVKINTSQLRSGVYSIQIQIDNQKTIKSKFVVMH
jgi:hypothetical protein